MKRLFSTIVSTSVLTTVVIAGTAGETKALQFNFSGTDQNGTGSATMEFFDQGSNEWKVEVDNTSPTNLNNNSGVNAPAITSFGFDANEPVPAVSSWQLTAIGDNVNDTGNALSRIIIGSSNSGDIQTSSDGTWTLSEGGNVEGIKLDFQPNTKDVKGGIYNPSATNGLASGPNHFSKAILNITFNSSFTLDENSPKVRMKNVGLNGEGSLKLDGTSVTQPVPEPMTMLGWGTGLAVGALAKKKYGQKKSATSKV